MNGSNSLFSDKFSSLAICASDADSTGDVTRGISAHAALVMEACRCVLQARAVADLQPSPEGRARVAADARAILDAAEQSLTALRTLVGDAIAPEASAADIAALHQISSSSASSSSSVSMFPAIPTTGRALPSSPSAQARHASPFPEIPTSPARAPFPRAPTGAGAPARAPFPSAPMGATAARPPAFGMPEPSQPALNNTLQLLKLIPGVRIDSSKMDLFNNLTRAEVDRVNRVVADFDRDCQAAQKQLEEKRQRLESAPERTRASALADLRREAMRKQKEVEFIARSRQTEVINTIIREHVPRPAAGAAAATQRPQEETMATKMRDSALFRRAAELYEAQKENMQARKDFKQVVEDGGDTTALRTNMKHYLNDPEHPLCKKLLAFVNDFRYMRFPDKAALLAKVLAFRDRLTDETEKYLTLNPMSEAHEVVQELVTEAIVCSLYKPISAAFNKEYAQEDQAANEKIAKYSCTLTPADIGVDPKFWLVDEVCCFFAFCLLLLSRMCAVHRVR